MAIALISGATNHNELSTAAATPDINTVPLATLGVGTLAIYAVGWDDTVESVASCVDDVAGTTNTWSKIVSKAHSLGGTANEVDIWACILTTAIPGTNGVKATFTANVSQARSCLCGFSGYTGTITADQTGTGQTTSTSPITCASMTPTSSDAVAFGCIMWDNSGAAITPSGTGSWTELTDAFAGGTTDEFETQYSLLASTSTINVAGTSATPGHGVVASVVFKNASSSATPQMNIHRVARVGSRS